MKLIQEKEPHIVLTDITMPIMDAFMMFEATRTLSYEKVILSGYNDFQNAKKAMQYGAVDFLSKPIDTKELTECLQKLFCDYELALVKKLLLEEYQTLLTSIQQVDTQNQIIHQTLEFVASTLLYALYHFYHCRESRI